MGITFHWHNDDKTIICWIFDRVWTWEDALHVQQQCKQMIGTVEHSVHYLLDVSQSHVMPLGALQRMPEIFNDHYPKRGLSLIVVNHRSSIYPLWKTFSAILPASTQAHVLFFVTLEEAEKHLANISAPTS